MPTRLYITVPGLQQKDFYTSTPRKEEIQAYFPNAFKFFYFFLNGHKAPGLACAKCKVLRQTDAEEKQTVQTPRWLAPKADEGAPWRRLLVSWEVTHDMMRTLGAMAVPVWFVSVMGHATVTGYTASTKHTASQHNVPMQQQ